MRIRWLVAASVLGALLSLPGGARAGGWTWLDFKREYYVVGQKAVGHEDDVYRLGGQEYGWVDDGPYYAYLVRSRDFSPKVPHSAEPIAKVAVTSAADDTASVRLAFTVPDLPSGPYVVRLCTEGCKLTLGDLAEGRFTIVASRAEVRLRQQIDRLSSDLSQARGEESRLERKAADLEGRGMVAAKREQVLAQSGERLRAELASVQRVRRLPWVVAVAGSLLALAIGFIAARRLPRRERDEKPPGVPSKKIEVPKAERDVARVPEPVG